MGRCSCGRSAHRDVVKEPLFPLPLKHLIARRDPGGKDAAGSLLEFFTCVNLNPQPPK